MEKSPSFRHSLESRRVILLTIAAATMVLMIIAANALVLRRMHEQTLRDVEASLLLDSFVLSEVVEQTFRSVDLVLESVVEKVRLAASTDNGSYWQRLASRDLHDLLREKASGLPQIFSLTIVDSGGTRISSSREWPASNINLSDREYFQAIKSNPKGASFVSGPVRSRITGTWKIVLGRPVVTADGEFLGEVHGSMALENFEAFFRATSLGEGYAVALVRRDGTLLVRYPMAGQIGVKVASIPILRILANSRSGVAHAISPFDQQARIAAGHALMSYPLVVIATRNEENAFAAWRQTATIMLVTGVCLIVVVVLAAFAVAAWWRQQERLRYSEERRRFAVEAAGIGIWNWDFVTNELSWSDRLREIVGVSSTNTPSHAAYFDCVYPPDRHIVENNKDRCLSGQRQYEIEYRVLGLNDRSPRWVNSKGSVDCDGFGKPLRMQGVIQDITARKDAERERDDLRRRLMQAQEDERLRLAHELHDQTGQDIAAAMLELNRIETLVGQSGRHHLRLLRNQMEQIGKTLHHVAWELRPASIDEVGLENALATYISEWGTQFGIEVDFHCRDSKLDELPDEVRTTIYRVVQEGLTNIAKHALETTSVVSVIVDRLNAILRLTIEDDGCGFDLALPTESESQRVGGLGLTGMRERLLLIGGELEIESSVGKGTTIFVRIPLERVKMTA